MMTQTANRKNRMNTEIDAVLTRIENKLGLEPYQPRTATEVLDSIEYKLDKALDDQWTTRLIRKLP